MTDPVATCPNGHTSTEADYCSVCGAKMGGPATPRVDSPASREGDAAQCPNCQADLEPASKFCEVCGFDPETGTLPAAPVPRAADAADAPAAGAKEAGDWVGVVAADRSFYERNDVTDMQFPLGVPARTIKLTGDQVSIGRRSPTRGTEPGIDLAGPPEDAAVSHSHASLLRQPDGTWAVVDHGSTNGTYLNDASDPLAPNTPTPLHDGDRLLVGAWTSITVEHRKAP